MHDDVIICAYVTTPFDKLKVTGHGEPVEPCAWYSLVNDNHEQLFMTPYIKLIKKGLMHDLLTSKVRVKIDDTVKEAYNLSEIKKK